MVFFKYYSAPPYAESKDIMAPLRYHAIRYTSPELFNDPYDCKCFFQGIDSEKEDIFSEIINKHLRIACLSRNPHSPIMWSHYSSDHKGYLIEYDIREAAYEKVEYKEIEPFYYSTRELKEAIDKEYPNIPDSEIQAKMKQLLEESPVYIQKLKDAIFTKHLDWIYEEEYRFMDTNKSGFSGDYIDQNLLPEQINSIVLGYRFDHDKHDLELQSIIQEVYGGNLPVYKAQPCLDSYKMIVTPYKFKAPQSKLQKLTHKIVSKITSLL